jgi:response regulator RpfG family c-di-GMP phosphodiesterase
MNSKILCVDDDANILAAYQRNLRKQFDIDAALGGEQALDLVGRQGPYAVIVADMQMPGMNGIEFLTRVQQKAPDTVRIMLTGNADQSTAVEAVNQGRVYRFLNKPCSPDMLALALEAGTKQYRLVMAEREILEQTLKGSVKVMADILSAVDPRAFGQGQILRDHMRVFLKSLGLQESWEYEVAALLSQIGYVTIPLDVLKRAREQGGLTGAERDMLARAPETGHNLLNHIPRLEEVARIILYQQKNFDGTGFPSDSIAGEEIPVVSRILKVLSELTELETKGRSKGTALLEMQQRPGRYDPRVLDAAFACFDAYLPESTTIRSAVKALKLGELCPGQILAANLETIEGMLLVPSGHQLTSVILQKIRNFAAVSGIHEPIQVQIAHAKNTC